MINEFRDLVNDNSNFVCNQYKNKDGKNLWNLICSCMDWITVSVRYLKEFPELSKNIDIRVMQMYSFISSIDIVFESITQLHRVFISNKTVPFEKDCKIFSNKFVDKNDNDYFKEIRACFGAHPVNLTPKLNEKRFASWPYDEMSGDSSLDILLYSNIPGEEDIKTNLNIAELTHFLFSRYNYINIISEAIKIEFNAFTETQKNKKIISSSSILDTLNILLVESKIRLNNDYYNGVINDLIIIFRTHLSVKELQAEEAEFKEDLLVLIEEIKNNLQHMNIQDLENEKLISASSNLSSELGYILPKFYSWLYHGNYDALVDYYIRTLNKISANRYSFSELDGSDVLFLKLSLMLRKLKLEQA